MNHGMNDSFYDQGFRNRNLCKSPDYSLHEDLQILPDDLCVLCLLRIFCRSFRSRRHPPCIFCWSYMYVFWVPVSSYHYRNGGMFFHSRKPWFCIRGMQPSSSFCLNPFLHNNLEPSSHGTLPVSVRKSNRIKWWSLPEWILQLSVFFSFLLPSNLFFALRFRFLVRR